MMELFNLLINFWNLLSIYCVFSLVLGSVGDIAGIEIVLGYFFLGVIVLWRV